MQAHRLIDRSNHHGQADVDDRPPDQVRAHGRRHFRERFDDLAANFRARAEHFRQPPHEHAALHQEEQQDE